MFLHETAVLADRMGALGTQGASQAPYAGHRRLRFSYLTPDKCVMGFGQWAVPASFLMFGLVAQLVRARA